MEVAKWAQQGGKTTTFTNLVQASLPIRGAYVSQWTENYKQKRNADFFMHAAFKYGFSVHCVVCNNIFFIVHAGIVL